MALPFPSLYRMYTTVLATSKCNIIYFLHPLYILLSRIRGPYSRKRAIAMSKRKQTQICSIRASNPHFLVQVRITSRENTPTKLLLREHKLKTWTSSDKVEYLFNCQTCSNVSRRGWLVAGMGLGVYSNAQFCVCVCVCVSV